MLERILEDLLRRRLTQFPCVAVIGPRQVGKTTLARAIAEEHDANALYLDLEDPADRRRLDDPGAFLGAHGDKLVVLDEIHRAPEIFATLRGRIDERRRAGRRAGHFLILGSASLTLLRQSSESLAGRIVFLELTPLQPQEVGADSATAVQRLWSRGGFPDSYLAADEEESFAWRRAFLRTYLERDIPQFGVRIPAETLERFWTMLAHLHGGLLNSQRLASGLGTAWSTAAGYLDLMVDLLLIRRLQPWASNRGKRLVKAPKIYVRDSGVLHALLNIPTHYDLLGHPVVGASWEGMVIEALIAAAPPTARPYFYRTSNGSELDLVLELSSTERWAFEIKKGHAPTLSAGTIAAFDDVAATRRFLVHGADDEYPTSGGATVVPLSAALEALRELGR